MSTGDVKNVRNAKKQKTNRDKSLYKQLFLFGRAYHLLRINLTLGVHSYAFGQALTAAAAPLKVRLIRSELFPIPRKYTAYSSSMNATTSPTVFIFSSASSGTSFLNSSSKVIARSIRSRLSADKSSRSFDSAVISSSGISSCSLKISHIVSYTVNKHLRTYLTRLQNLFERRNVHSVEIFYKFIERVCGFFHSAVLGTLEIYRYYRVMDALP